MNDIEIIEKKIKELEAEMKLLEDKMSKLADYATPAYRGKDKKEKSELYYKIKKQHTDLVKKRSVYIWERVRLTLIFNT